MTSRATALVTPADAHDMRAHHIGRWLLLHYPDYGWDWWCCWPSDIGSYGISSSGADIATDGDTGWSFGCVERASRDEYGYVMHGETGLIGYLDPTGTIEGLY